MAIDRAIRILVDLTPLLPGGENGGARIMTLELLRNLAALAPEWKFILLASAANYQEITSLQVEQMQTECIEMPGSMRRVCDNFAVRLRQRLSRLAPASALDRLAAVYRKVTERGTPSAGPMQEIGAGLLFCPFTVPPFFDPDVPIVSIIYDLQHEYYPQFFDSAELRRRQQGFGLAYRTASRIVCISDYVRSTVLEHSGLPADRVVTVPVQLQNRFAYMRSVEGSALLESLGLRPDGYLLYPANYWRHKNHELLLTAFGMYRAENPRSDLKLVFTGAPGERQEYLARAVRRMGLGDAVVFAGFVRDEELAALLNSCMALIFPSLFEGFGMPVLEAMSAGKPVLAANGTSLPEIAGDAALLFDPRKPREISSAIHRIASCLELRAELAAKGLRRSGALGNPERMARQYLQIFTEAMEEAKAPK